MVRIEKDVITAAIKFVKRAVAHREVSDAMIDFSELKDVVDSYEEVERPKIHTTRETLQSKLKHFGIEDFVFLTSEFSVQHFFTPFTYEIFTDYEAKWRELGGKPY